MKQARRGFVFWTDPPAAALTWQSALDLGEMDLASVHIGPLAGSLLFSLRGLLVFLSLLLSLMPSPLWGPRKEGI